MVEIKEEVFARLKVYLKTSGFYNRYISMEEFNMNSKLKKYAGAAGMLIGAVLTLEAVQEDNAMLMLESILLAIAGACYAFPVKNLLCRGREIKRKFLHNMTFN